LALVEVEKLNTFPAESVMSGLPGVTQVPSLSEFGLSVRVAIRGCAESLTVRGFCGTLSMVDLLTAERWQRWP